VSDFFEPRPPPPTLRRIRRPVWSGPLDNELGVAVPLQLEVARTERVALAVVGVVAFSRGFSFRFTIRRRVDGDAHDYPFHHFHHPAGMESDALKFGIEFADGSKATTLGRPPSKNAFDETQGPVLSPGGGGGGPRSYDVSMWVWPLPPAGPLAFVCEWIAAGVVLTRHEIEAQAILDAAVRSEPLWPDDDDGEGGNASTVVTFERE
jgi:hypothetical protein